MKTTLDMPDSLYREVKASAARQGRTMASFVTSALETKLAEDRRRAEDRPWMAFAGVFRDDPEGSTRIRKVIEEGCGKIDPA